jgi:hypothetical protein
MLTWALWFETSRERIVAQNYVGDFFVSTIFIGLEPVFFETMVFGAIDRDVVCRSRTRNWAEAEAEHARTLKLFATPACWSTKERLMPK